MQMKDFWRSDSLSQIDSGKGLPTLARTTGLSRKRRNLLLDPNSSSKLSATALGDHARQPLPLLVTVMSCFNELSCHSVPLIVVNFPQSEEKRYQLTRLTNQKMVLAFHLHNEILQSAVKQQGASCYI